MASEKSYDSESDIDLSYIEELERQEEEERRKTEANDPFQTHSPKADGNPFLQDLLERNFDDADEAEK